MSAEHNHKPRCCCERYSYGTTQALKTCPGCPEHGALSCTCPPHIDGIGRDKWPDCPVHSLATPYTEQETTNG